MRTRTNDTDAGPQNMLSAVTLRAYDDHDQCHVRRAAPVGQWALGRIICLIAWMAFFAVSISLFDATPAAAQQVCGTSTTGTEPQTGNGATATGTGSLACGPNSTAGQNSTAVGPGALAGGSGA